MLFYGFSTFEEKNYCYYLKAAFKLLLFMVFYSSYAV